MVCMFVTCQNGLSLCLLFKIWSVSRLVIGRPTIGYNVFGLGEGGDFTTKFDAKAQILINKCFSGALNCQFCQTRVSSRIKLSYY
jgi:hypothetical protein